VELAEIIVIVLAVCNVALFTLVYLLMYLRVPRAYYDRVARTSGERSIQILRRRALWTACLCVGVIAWVVSPKLFGVEGRRASWALQTRILGALGLGVYTCVGIRFYSVLISHTKSDLFRLLLFLLCAALLFFAPLLGWASASSQKINGWHGFC